VRFLVLAFASLLIASAMLADEPTTTRPDYSREALLHLVASNDIRMSPLPDHLPPGRIQWHLGWAEFRALGMHWRIFYLPIVVPLAGSGMQNAANVPNPLEMTGTPFPASPQLFPDRTAAVDRELKRVLKMEKQAKVGGGR
jgi:hypothetical protein